MKLFAIYIGGEHPGAHIEVHDVRFAVADTIHATHHQLRAEWWGKPATLHSDCWAEIAHADGYDVTLSETLASAPERLYFANLGGYDPRDFAEQHRNVFVVATSVAAAKARAIATVTNWKDSHRDDFYEAEQVFALDTKIGGRLHIHLTKADHPTDPAFTCRYIPLK